MAQGESPSGRGAEGAGGAPWADLAARLTRVEEHAGFTEHTVEQLSAEMAAMNKRMHELLRRIDGLERRLAELTRPEEDKPGEGNAADAGTG